jgi:hypothetical protein
MATFTTRLGLRKPATTDLVDVGTDVNDSMDIIDNAIGFFRTNAFPGSPYSGRPIMRSDLTDNLFVYNGSVWLPVQGIPAFADEATRDAVLTGPVTGDTAYIVNFGIFTYYTGSAWSTFAQPGAWAPFTPTWTGSATNPVYNNAVVGAAFKRESHMVHFRIAITMGNTTTFGTGQWSFSLPVAPGFDQVVPVVYTDSSAAVRFCGSALLTNGSGGIERLLGPVDAGNAGVTNLYPMTWATNDQIVISGVYETG